MRLTKGREAKAQVFEVFGRLPTDREPQWAPETVLRCEVRARHLGRCLARGARRVQSTPQGGGEAGRPLGRGRDGGRNAFSARNCSCCSGRWRPRDVTAEEIAVAIRNWHGLKPEERWWLYTMTAATTGLAHQAGMGWRGALRQALCFGTRSDAFNLSAVAGRGTLGPARQREVRAVRSKESAAGEDRRRPGIAVPDADGGRVKGAEPSHDRSRSRRRAACPRAVLAA